MIYVTIIALGYIVCLFLLSNIKYKNFPLLIYTANYYPTKGGHTYQAFKEYDRDGNYDLIFIGSSHAYRSYDPRIFDKYNINSFNMGTSGQSLESSLIVLKKIVNKSNVKNILLEIDRTQLSGTIETNESGFDIAYNAPTYLVVFEYVLRFYDWRFINLLSYKLFTESHQLVYKDTTYLQRGYSIKQDSAKCSYFIYNEAKPLSTEKLNVLEDIIKLTKANDINLIVASQPMPKGYSQQEHNCFLNYIKPLLNQYNIEHFDYTFNSTFKTGAHFFDHSHLNQSGVNIYDSLLLNNNLFIKQIHAK